MSHSNLYPQNLSSRYPPDQPCSQGLLTQVLKNTLRLLPQRSQNKGFTLIELLVVIIILGVLSAIALPQMLQIIGRSRESEARSLIGAMNRAQQAYFNEKATFARSAVELEVPVGNEKYYLVFVDSNNDFTQGGLQGAKGIDNATNGTRDYSAAVSYDPIERTYKTVVCRSISQASNYQINRLRSQDTTLGTGRVGGVIGGTNAQCVQSAGVETVEELR
ncbi:type IV pilin-like G/H family protein [Cyanothece sp. BG0011]|uniref:type IV pilin-like G/H family protein n=1 Tax=Cyanothece sp. BG0011 TaxID=2082950 RepID=UPI000D1EF863|nr:type IV pilin-like G/H family protein [Cyanothece sp. BG0011]